MTTKEKIFNDNIGLVYKVINDNFACFKKGEFYGDLFNEGCVALLKSIDKFDASKGFKFSTFACKNIYFTISLYLIVSSLSTLNNPKPRSRYPRRTQAHGRLITHYPYMLSKHALIHPLHLHPSGLSARLKAVHSYFY